MALISCPDCGVDVSDSAPNCIKCGRPIATHSVLFPSNPTIHKGEPAKKDIGTGTVLLLMLAGLAGIAMIILTTQTQNEPTPIAEPQSQQPTPVPPPPAYEFIRLGNSKPIGDFSYKVQQYVFKKRLDFGYQVKKPDGVFLLVKMGMKNQGSEARTFSDDMILVVDDQNRQYKTSSDVNRHLPRGEFLYKQINPGISTEGDFAFEVPTEAQRYTVVIVDQTGEQQHGLFAVNWVPNQPLK